MCAVDLVVALAFDWLGNVLAETPVTKADTILEMLTAEWEAFSKPLVGRCKSTRNQQSVNCTLRAIL